MPALTPTAPFLLVGAAVAAFALGVVGRRTRTAGVRALLVLAWGVVVATTLTPSVYTPYDPHIGCSFALTIGMSPHERLANVLLYVPLGAVSWFARPRRAWLVAACAAPFLIEAVQGLVVAMNRGCDVMDVVANVTGVDVGALLGATAYAVLPRLRAHSPDRAGDPLPVVSATHEP